MKEPPRVLIEDWLPAAAIGVECMRERSTGQNPPNARLHVWWARRPLAVSRAAVLGSLLPADFPHDGFEKLLGFWGSSEELLAAQDMLDRAREEKMKIPNPHGERAFKRGIPERELNKARLAMAKLWRGKPVVLDPMAGGGSIPLEAARLGLDAIANEYNPVACVILEATVDYPFRFGVTLAEKTREWGAVLRKRFNKRMATFYPKVGIVPPLCYIFARTVPCPDTQHYTPLVPDWHLLNPKDKGRVVVAVPVVDKEKGTWSVNIRDPWNGKQVPRPTYSGGKGFSLFSDTVIEGEYIKAMAQTGKMKSALYAVAVKGKRLQFRPPTAEDLDAIDAAEKALAKLRPAWEKSNIIPTEEYPDADETTDPRPRIYGMTRWADMFSPRQLLAMGVLVEELRNLRPEIVKAEGEELGEAVNQLIALALDKLLDYNNSLATWESSRGIAKHMFQRHDFSFKPTFAEMAPCHAGSGLDWAIDNVCSAYEDLAKLPRAADARPAAISLGSATSLTDIADKSITAVVVDPPYADNVQYSELADFFYVWLKRTQGHRRPDWFSSYLCDHTEEAVVNLSRHRQKTDKDKGEARKRAHEFYQRLMAESFREARRVLRDDGVLTVMFTHKQQSAWAALFQSLISTGFRITATWPVKTESEHSLHQAKKNAAQSTVLLVCRKRPDTAEPYFRDDALDAAIRKAAVETAKRLEREGFNPVDQLVGSFGPAVSVLSQYATVMSQTGELVDVGQILELAADAVMEWRLSRLVPEGLKDLDAESQFVLLCWDVLQAAEFRFNESKLLGHAVNRDLNSLEAAGLVTRTGDKVRMVPALDRRREQKLKRREIDEMELDLGLPSRRRVPKGQVRKIHPLDPMFRTTIDACHALALAAVKRDGSVDIGAAKDLARRQGWLGKQESAVARLLKALVAATPVGLRNPAKKGSAAKDYPEFRAWHDLLEPLFGIEPPDWTEKPEAQKVLFAPSAQSELDTEEEAEDEESEASEE